MQIDDTGNTPKTHCDYCGDDIELISLIIRGTGLHCPHCFDCCYSDGHVGYISDLCGTGIEELHLVRIGG